ncbi:MAG: DUF502 domain-containing protein [Sutterellaceae bacterium]|nr:DUF502 domain-containing protein [Burkholderiaceae bacterium]MCX7902323.1 DUF502 domain-containing protein [Burkholderiaceae bacterium]MDW8430055.1 DUF502 domain-containing protein [Sutterellaceae bacterium]
MKESTKAHLRHTPRYLLLGVITAAPLWVTWLVFDFLLSQLSRLGSPWLHALAAALRRMSPALADALVDSWFQSLLAALVSLALLYLLGWGTSRVVGRRILEALEAVVQRIPLVAAIYGGTKRFLSVVKEKPGEVQRVVLIPFPTPQLRAVGFVTRVLQDEASGRKIAAVYVPTSPNPTSGYIELVPLEHCTPTDWSMDEAMSFVITGGATAPERVRFGAAADA